MCLPTGIQIAADKYNPPFLAQTSPPKALAGGWTDAIAAKPVNLIHEALNE